MFFLFFFFWERDQDRDAKRDHALYINFSQSNWFIAQNERSDWLLQQEIAITRILIRAKRPQRWTFIHEIATSTVQLLQMFKQNYNQFASKHSHWHLQWCNHRRSHLERPRHWSLNKKNGILWHTNTSSVVWSLMYNSKLANQIARLVEIVANTNVNRIQQMTWTV